MALVGRTPHKPLAIRREAREIFMTATSRQIHQLHVLRDSKEADLFHLLAVFGSEPQDFARSSRSAVARRIHAVKLGAVKIPVNLATITGLRPHVLRQVPYARFTHRTTQRNRQMLTVRAHVRFLQNHAGLFESLFAIEHERFLFAGEVHRKDLACAAEHNRLAIRAPRAPRRVFDNLRFVRTVNTDSPQVPFFRVVRIVFRHPSALAAVKEHLRAIWSHTREPIHIIALGKRTGIRPVRIHNPDIMERINTACRPDNRPFELAFQRIESLLFFGSRIDRSAHRSTLCCKRRNGQKANRRNQRKLFHIHDLKIVTQRKSCWESQFLHPIFRQCGK